MKELKEENRRLKKVYVEERPRLRSSFITDWLVRLMSN